MLYWVVEGRWLGTERDIRQNMNGVVSGEEEGSVLGEE